MRMSAQYTDVNEFHVSSLIWPVVLSRFNMHQYTSNFSYSYNHGIHSPLIIICPPHKSKTKKDKIDIVCVCLHVYKTFIKYHSS